MKVHSRVRQYLTWQSLLQQPWNNQAKLYFLTCSKICEARVLTFSHTFCVLSFDLPPILIVFFSILMVIEALTNLPQGLQPSYDSVPEPISSKGLRQAQILQFLVQSAKSILSLIHPQRTTTSQSHLVLAVSETCSRARFCRMVENRPLGPPEKPFLNEPVVCEDYFGRSLN